VLAWPPRPRLQTGDKLPLPDTASSITRRLRHLHAAVESGTIQSISADGLTVTLTAALQYNTRRATPGMLAYLPQVMDMTRNVTCAAERTGTRGYTLFTQRRRQSHYTASAPGPAPTTVRSKHHDSHTVR